MIAIIKALGFLLLNIAQIINLLQSSRSVARRAWR